MQAEYGINLVGLEHFRDLDGLILAVVHEQYLKMGLSALEGCIRPGGVFVDVKGAFEGSLLTGGRRYWSL